MTTLHSEILDQIRRLLIEIVAGDGQISTSIYDTAQLLRWSPPADPTAALDWLLLRQQPDGGWCDPRYPHHRQPATLAATLALLHHRHRLPQAHAAIEASVDFLKLYNEVWTEAREDMPVGAELILPQLLTEAASQGIAVPSWENTALHELGIRRHLLIQRLQPGAATTAAHCWEGWGVEPRTDLLDQAGSIGHSPAATAAWLHAARRYKHLDEAREKAQNYLVQAARATKSGVIGVVPTVWPNQGFEIIFGLFALQCAGLLDHDSLKNIVNPMIAALSEQIEPNGVSFSYFFAPDGDDTATAMIILRSTGYSVQHNLLYSFANGDIFATWINELQVSISTTAHAVHALSLLGHPVPRVVQRLISCQSPQGYWERDKWHSSRYYTTSQVLLALSAAGEELSVHRTIEWLLSQQRQDGGWGTYQSTRIETSYVVLALYPFAHQEKVAKSIRRSGKVLIGFYNEESFYWIAKELYKPYHVDRVFELSAAWVVANMRFA